MTTYPPDQAMSIPVVTVIRKRVVYDECVMSVDELHVINNLLATDSSECWEQANELLTKTMKDAEVNTGPVEYIAVRGDVTGYTDDFICDNEHYLQWSDEGEHIEIYTEES